MSESVVTLTDLCFALAELYAPDDGDGALRSWSWPATFGRLLRDRQAAGRSPFPKDNDEDDEEFVAGQENKVFFSFTVALTPDVKSKCAEQKEAFRRLVAGMMALQVLKRYLYSGSADALVSKKQEIDTKLVRANSKSVAALSALLARLPATHDALLAHLKKELHGASSPLGGDAFGSVQIAEVFHNKLTGQSHSVLCAKVKATPDLEDALDKVLVGNGLTDAEKKEMAARREKIQQAHAKSADKRPDRNRAVQASAKEDTDPLEKWRQLPSYGPAEVGTPGAVDWSKYVESTAVKGGSGSGGIDLYNVAGKVVAGKWVKSADKELYPVRLASALNVALGDAACIRLANLRLLGDSHDAAELQRLACTMFDVAGGKPVGTTKHLDLDNQISVKDLPDGMKMSDLHDGGLKSDKDENGNWVVDRQTQSPEWLAFVVKYTITWKLSTSKLLLLECVKGMQTMQGVGGFHKVPPDGREASLQALGRLCAFDVVINNMDRLPLKLVWGNEGNFENVMISQDGSTFEIVGIDTQVWPITDPKGQDDYRMKIRSLCHRLDKWPGDASEDESAWAKELREGIFGSTGVQVGAVQPFLTGVKTVLERVGKDLCRDEERTDALLKRVEDSMEVPVEEGVRGFLRGNLLAVRDGFAAQ